MPEDTVIRDPSKKRFWTVKNILAALALALLPAVCTWAVGALSDAWKTIKAMDERIKGLEADKANNQAIWDSIAENKNETSRQREDLRVMQRLFDREFDRSPGPKAVEPPRWEEPKPPLTRPEDLRSMMEQKYPSKK